MIQLRAAILALCAFILIQANSTAQGTAPGDAGSADTEQLNSLFLSGGAVIPTNHKVSGVYTAGYTASAGMIVRKPAYSLTIEPSIGLTGYHKAIGNDNSTKDNVNIFSASATTAYQFKHVSIADGQPIYAVASLGYNLVRNYISSESLDLNSLRTNVSNSTVMKGQGFSGGLGVRCDFSQHISLQAQYCFVPVQLQLSDEVMENFQSNGIITSQNQKFSFSNIKLELIFRFLPF